MKKKIFATISFFCLIIALPACSQEKKQATEIGRKICDEVIQAIEEYNFSEEQKKEIISSYSKSKTVYELGNEYIETYGTSYDEELVKKLANDAARYFALDGKVNLKWVTLGLRTIKANDVAIRYEFALGFIEANPPIQSKDDISENDWQKIDTLVYENPGVQQEGELKTLVKNFLNNDVLANSKVIDIRILSKDVIKNEN